MPSFLAEAARGGGRFTEAVLRPRGTLAPGSDASAVEGLHGAAHAFSFIANSVNFPIRHEATTVAAAAGD